MDDAKPIVWANLVRSCDRRAVLARMPDAEIADRLLHVVWSNTPLHTLESDLLEEAIDRLRAPKFD